MTRGVDADVLVVGGGPVGLAAAIEARLAGLSVVVVERRPGPVDKACGEGLMPGAVAALGRIGVRPEGVPFAGIRYTDGTCSVVHRFRRGRGLGVRRTTLHAALADRAKSLGAETIRASVDEVSAVAGGVDAAGLRARWLLGCDGLHSRVRGAVGLTADAGPVSARRYGQRVHLRTAPWTDVVEVHWSPRAEAYVTPVAPDLVGVAVLGPRGLPLGDALAQMPELTDRLEGASYAGRVLGAGPLRQRVRARVAGRVLLVGDAGGYVDALTGEGLRVGLAEARAAVAAVVGGDPHAYEREWQQATRDYRRLTGGLVAVAGRPRLRKLVVPAATRLPGVFGAAVERLAR